MKWRAAFPGFLALMGAGVVLGISFGFLGELHPAFDTFSNLRLQFAALLLVISLGLFLCPGWRLAGALSLVVVAATLAATVGPWRLSQSVSAAAATDSLPAARYRLMQLNLRYDNETPNEVLSLIGRTAPDVITLDEVSGRWKDKLALIEKAYPYSIICPPPSFIGGVAILSRRPFSRTSKPVCYDRGSLAVARVDFGGRDVAIAAVHYGWPWPFDQPHQLPTIMQAVGDIGPDAVLAGDFNAVPWSRTVELTARAGAFRIVRGIGSSWLPLAMPATLRGLIGLPIDNILVKGRVVTDVPRKLEGVGSDHLPLLMEFAITPETDPPGQPQQALAWRRPAREAAHMLR